MTLVVGYAVDPVEEAPLRLAAALARTGGEDVVLATVTPRGFDDPRTDREYRRFVAAAVRAAQEAAVPALDGVPRVRTVALEAPSVPAGLVTAVRQVEGSLLVLAPRRGRRPAGSPSAASPGTCCTPPPFRWPWPRGPARPRRGSSGSAAPTPAPAAPARRWPGPPGRRGPGACRCGWSSSRRSGRRCCRRRPVCGWRRW